MDKPPSDRAVAAVLATLEAAADDADHVDLSRREIADRTMYASRTVSRALLELAKTGRVTRIGGPASTRYRVERTDTA